MSLDPRRDEERCKSILDFFYKKKRKKERIHLLFNITNVYVCFNKNTSWTFSLFPSIDIDISGSKKGPEYLISILILDTYRYTYRYRY